MSSEEQQMLDSVLRASMEDFGASVYASSGEEEKSAIEVPADAPASTPAPAQSSAAVAVQEIASPPSAPTMGRVVAFTAAPAPVTPAPPAVQVEDADIGEDPSASSLPAAVAVWARVWAKELEVLGAMGFTDTAVLIPLLQEYVGVPVSLTPEANGELAVDKMQRLVATLLGRSA